MLIDKDQSAETHELKYGRSVIEYRLVYENRNNLAISVRPDKSVIVKAPAYSKFEKIQLKLQKRGQWVLKQINYFDKFHPLQTTRDYVSGETHYYLGRQYRLRIRKDKEDSVRLIGKFFIIKTKEPEEREHVKLLLNLWYADHAKALLDTRVKHYSEIILGSNFKKVKIDYKYSKTRWGNNDQNGTIVFNIELIKTPIQCIDYVIVHELCHLAHPNHDKAFYRLMQSIIPDWRERKERLEIFGAGRIEDWAGR